jgi:hypothetical protein
VKIIFCIFSLFLLGCVGKPLEELNLSGHIPATRLSAERAVVDFSEILAARTNLRKVSESKKTGNSKVDDFFSVHLVPVGKDDIYITVFARESHRLFNVRLGGDISSLEAENIFNESQVIYEELFPGSRISPCTRMQGLLGP